MGESSSKYPVGSKSSLPFENDKDIDYHDPKNIKIAQEELYKLFLESKLVHVDKLDEVYKNIDSLEKENKALKDQVNNYKKLNGPKVDKASIIKPVSSKLQSTIVPIVDDSDIEIMQSKIDRIANNIKSTQNRLKNSKDEESEDSEPEELDDDNYQEY
jgi:hypothetical protein